MAVRASIQKSVLATIGKYKQLLQNEGINLSKMLVFGSHAKGTAGPDSDIDLAVVSPQFGHDRLAEAFWLRKISLRIDTHIEPIPFSPQELKDRYSTLAQEINKYGLQV
jgi:uncharacterized protein